MGRGVPEELLSVDESQSARIEPEDVSTIDQEKVEDPAAVRLDTEVGDGNDASPVGGTVLEEVPSVDESQSASIEPGDVSTIDQSSLLEKNEEKVEDPAEVRLDTEVGDGNDACLVGGAVLEEMPRVDGSQSASIEPEDVSTIDQLSLLGKNEEKVEDPDKVRLDTEVGDGKDASPVGGAVLEEVPSVDESQSASIEPEDVSTIDQSSLLGKNEEKVEDPAEVRLDTEVGDGKDASPVGAVLEEVASVDESQSASLVPEDFSTIVQSSLLGKNEENVEDPSEVRMEMCGTNDARDSSQLAEVLENVQTGGQSQVTASSPEPKNVSFQVDGEEKVEDLSLEKMEVDEDKLGDGIDAGGEPSEVRMEICGTDYVRDSSQLTEVLENVQTGGQSQVAASSPESENASFQVDGEGKVEDLSLEKMEVEEDKLGDGIDAGGTAPESASERLGHFQDVGTLTEDSSEMNPPPSSADANDESAADGNVSVPEDLSNPPPSSADANNELVADGAVPVLEDSSERNPPPSSSDANDELFADGTVAVPGGSSDKNPPPSSANAIDECLADGTCA
ncbi:hypothetical protein NL676_009255 [Syzygium grande]|nr:hypothetical protein NL676_009255 [Syzygium grande]